MTIHVGLIRGGNITDTITDTDAPLLSVRNYTPSRGFSLRTNIES